MMRHVYLSISLTFQFLIFIFVSEKMAAVVPNAELIPIPGIGRREIPICSPSIAFGVYGRMHRTVHDRGYRISNDVGYLDEGWDRTIYDRNFQISIIYFTGIEEITNFMIDIWENFEGIFAFYLRYDRQLPRLQFRFSGGYIEPEELINFIHRFWNGTHKLPSELGYEFDGDMEIPY